MRRGLLTVYVCLVLAFLMAPIVIIVLFSLNQRQSLTFPIELLSFRWYEQAAANATLTTALENSLLVAAGALALVVLIGTPAAWAIARVQFRGRRVLLATLVAPLTLPGLFIGIALLTFFARLEVEPSLRTVVVAHVLFTVGFYVLVMSAQFSALDPALVEAARTLGARRVAILRLIIWPTVRPALLGAVALCFALSMDEFLITFFVIGPENTLPIVIFSNIRVSVTPEIAATATFLLALSWVAVAIAAFVTYGREFRRARRQRAVAG
jgi:spermidine/putrescine transport system permease protein